jgi:hypothetical protein
MARQQLAVQMKFRKYPSQGEEFVAGNPLDSERRMRWFKQARRGVFIHPEKREESCP